MHEDGLIDALAEILDVEVELLELLNVSVEEDTGSSSDEWHYGYYVEFPTFESYDEDTQDRIKEYINYDNIPFGSTEYFNDGVLGNTEADPFGWKFEYEEEEYFLNHPTTKEEIKKTLGTIYNKINANEDEMIIKSLILFAYSIVDGFTKSFIWNIVKEKKSPCSDEKIMKIFDDTLLEKLSKTKGRGEVYTTITSKKLESIPFYNPIRNLLAHEVTSISIEDGYICFFDKSGEPQKHSIKIIFEKLNEYIGKL